METEVDTRTLPLRSKNEKRCAVDSGDGYKLYNDNTLPPKAEKFLTFSVYERKGVGNISPARTLDPRRLVYIYRV